MGCACQWLTAKAENEANTKQRHVKKGKCDEQKLSGISTGAEGKHQGAPHTIESGHKTKINHKNTQWNSDRHSLQCLAVIFSVLALSSQGVLNHFHCGLLIGSPREGVDHH